MSIERLDVLPTRKELVKAKKRKKLAEGIAEILQKELEVLIFALVEYREEANVLQTFLYDILANSYHLFIEAEMVSGRKKIKEFALTAPSIRYDLLHETKSGVLGIHFPELTINKRKEFFQKPRMSLFDAPMQLEEIVSRIRSVMDSIAELASLTAAIRETIELIALKRRQINVVQFMKIPQLDLTIKFIENILKETEHQDSIRIRVLQRKRKEKAEKFDESR